MNNMHFKKKSIKPQNITFFGAFNNTGKIKLSMILKWSFRNLFEFTPFSISVHNSGCEQHFYEQNTFLIIFKEH